MKILVACEFSGVVRQAFRDLGYDAWSCDLETSLDGSKFHICDDILDVIYNDSWDLMIAHPPCTYLCVSGARWWNERNLEFAKKLWFAPIPCICLENPIGILKKYIGKYSQIIQPWMFGHIETKATCLWLKGLPLLEATNIVPKHMRREICHNESPKIKNGLTRSARRSITYKGIAKAMAEQWGG